MGDHEINDLICGTVTHDDVVLFLYEHEGFTTRFSSLKYLD